MLLFIHCLNFAFQGGFESCDRFIEIICCCQGKLVISFRVKVGHNVFDKSVSAFFNSMMSFAIATLSDSIPERDKIINFYSFEYFFMSTAEFFPFLLSFSQRQQPKPI